MTPLERLQEAAELAMKVTSLPLSIEIDRDSLLVQEPERKAAILRVNGPSVRIRDTPAHLRVSNTSNFEATVTVSAHVIVAEPGYRKIRIDGCVTTRRLDASSITSAVGYAHYLSDKAGRGASLAEWFVFQEARRLKRNGVRYGFGLAHFKLQLYIPDEI